MTPAAHSIVNGIKLKTEDIVDHIKKHPNGMVERIFTNEPFIEICARKLTQLLEEKDFSKLSETIDYDLLPEEEQRKLFTTPIEDLLRQWINILEKSRDEFLLKVDLTRTIFDHWRINEKAPGANPPINAVIVDTQGNTMLNEFLEPIKAATLLKKLKMQYRLHKISEEAKKQWDGNYCYIAYNNQTEEFYFEKYEPNKYYQGNVFLFPVNFNNPAVDETRKKMNKIIEMMGDRNNLVFALSYLW